MDLDTLFQALLLTDKQAKESNPFSGLEDTGDLLRKALIPAAANYGVGENLAAGLLSGIIGGVGANLGRRYEDSQNAMARDLLSDAIAGRALTRPDSMAPSVFSTVQNAGSLFSAGRELQKQDEQRKIQNTIEQASQLAPIDVATDVAKEKARLGLVSEAYGGLGGLGALPPGLQDNALQQQQLKTQNQNIETFIEQQFEKAKSLPSLASSNPYTNAGNEMAGIGISLTTALQAALGREMNAKEQERLGAAVPDWNDTVEQIELKKQRFKDLMHTISKATPLADSLGGTAAGTYVTAGPAGQPLDSSGLGSLPAGALPTGRTYQGKPTYMVDGKLWVPD